MTTRRTNSEGAQWPAIFGRGCALIAVLCLGASCGDDEVAESRADASAGDAGPSSSDASTTSDAPGDSDASPVQADAPRHDGDLGIGLPDVHADSSPPSSDTGGPVDTTIALQSIRASATANEIRDTIGEHLVALGPPERRIGRLLLFYPGTGARPEQYTTFIRRAARWGYHAIGLSYHNSQSINFQICLRKPKEANCHAQARLEILTGTPSDYTPPDVDRPNSAFNRLVELLQYLQRTDPESGWNQYLDEASPPQPRWSRIVAAGHSQGGGHAAYTAKLHELPRVLLFGSTEPASWTTGTFATPADRFFGLAHQREQSYQGIIRSWQNLDLPGTLTSVDDTPPPFGNSHRLQTSSESCSGDPESRGYYHNCPIVDEYLPPTNERDWLRDAWDYLLGA
jgi:hypothetical protein